MNTAPKKSTVWLICIAGLVILVAVLVRTYFIKVTGIIVPPREQIGVACTLEAKICPDGSSVGRSGPQCEFAECPTVDISPRIPDGWKSYTIPDIGLTFAAPTEMSVTFETQRNDKGEPDVLTLFVQKENYQLYGLLQWNVPYSADALLALKEELQPGATETSISGYPAIEGQIKGQRNRYVTYIMTEKGRFGLFTSEPTEANRTLTEEILATFILKQ